MGHPHKERIWHAARNHVGEHRQSGFDHPCPSTQLRFFLAAISCSVNDLSLIFIPSSAEYLVGF